VLKEMGKEEEAEKWHNKAINIDPTIVDEPKW